MVFGWSGCFTMSSIICPTVLAANKTDFEKQLNNISFASRIQLDFMDGEFVETKSVKLIDIWLPENTQSDLHLMYKRPMEHLQLLLTLKPHMVIIHAESDVDHVLMAAELNKSGILAGLCVLPDTTIESVRPVLKSFDHLLIFGGHLGHFGGQADLSQLHKIEEAKEINPNLEFGWDGGANDDNAKKMSDEGVDVINVGGFIQKAENPQEAYKHLVELLK
jgi:ribulose-phosphate 3-epimerase